MVVQKKIEILTNYKVHLYQIYIIQINLEMSAINKFIERISTYTTLQVDKVGWLIPDNTIQRIYTDGAPFKNHVFTVPIEVHPEDELHLLCRKCLDDDYSCFIDIICCRSRREAMDKLNGRYYGDYEYIGNEYHGYEGFDLGSEECFSEDEEGYASSEDIEKDVGYLSGLVFNNYDEYYLWIEGDDEYCSEEFIEDGNEYSSEEVSECDSESDVGDNKAHSKIYSADSRDDDDDDDEDDDDEDNNGYNLETHITAASDNYGLVIGD